MKPIVTASIALLAVSCATMRVYQLPLTPSEGQAMVPALISASVGQNLESFRGPNGAVTTLEDGTQLSWQDSADHQDFILLVNLPGSAPEQEHQARFEAAKNRADQLWQIAMASRSMMVPPPAVVVVPQPAVVPAQTTTTTTVTAPGASISIGGSLLPNLSVTVNESAVQSTTTTTGSASATCCINGAGYSCPSAAAVDRCSGAFMRCMQACNFSCENKCHREAPLDPSGCSRNTAIDASCHR